MEVGMHDFAVRLLKEPSISNFPYSFRRKILRGITHCHRLCLYEGRLAIQDEINLQLDFTDYSCIVQRTLMGQVYLKCKSRE